MGEGTSLRVSGSHKDMVHQADQAWDCSLAEVGSSLCGICLSGLNFT